MPRRLALAPVLHDRDIRYTSGLELLELLKMEPSLGTRCRRQKIWQLKQD